MVEVEQQVVVVAAEPEVEKSGPLVSESDCGMLTSAWLGERGTEVL